MWLKSIIDSCSAALKSMQTQRPIFGQTFGAILWLSVVPVVSPVCVRLRPSPRPLTVPVCDSASSSSVRNGASTSDTRQADDGVVCAEGLVDRDQGPGKNGERTEAATGRNAAAVCETQFSGPFVMAVGATRVARR